MCLMGVEPYRLRGFTNEVSHTYGIFHLCLKKKAKSNRCVFTELLCELNRRADLNHRPSLPGRSNRSITSLRHLLGFKRRATGNQRLVFTINSRSKADLRHLLLYLKGYGQYALVLLYRTELQWNAKLLFHWPDSNRRHEVAHIYGTLIF